jgi:hypothetical protein
MTHDPLCSVQDDDPLPLQLLCICGELSAARRDTLAKCIEVVEALYVNDDDPEWDWPIQAATRALQALQTP